jgi:hypothetical protein
LDKQESDFQKNFEQSSKKNLVYLFNIFKRFRTLHQIKDLIQKETFEKDLMRLNENVISNETFLHKIQDLEKKERVLREQILENR